MTNAYRDENNVPTLIAVSTADGITPVRLWADPTTHRLLVDLTVGAGTVTSVSVVSANGFAGTVATPTTTPAITLSTTVNGILSGNGTAISAASTTGSGAVVLATSPTLVTPALGTPSSGVATNLTGTASSLTAGNVTTNANLTGPITSVGNATSIASQTGTGTKFVVDTSPTLVTPVLGVATATSINGLIISTSTGTLTVANGKTVTHNATTTFAGTDGKTLTISNSGTLAGGDAFVLAIAAAKTLTVSQSITLAGTDSTVMTFPTTTATIARTDAAQTFTGTQTFSGNIAPINSNGSALFAMDTSGGSNISVANNATATPLGNANNFKGMLLITDTFNQQTGLFLIGNGTSALVAQTITTAYSNTATTASRTNIYVTGSVVTLENKVGATNTYNIQTFRTTATN